MRKLIAKDLKIKFIETLNELDEFSYEEGNPFLIKIGSTIFFVFLKNLSSAYFKNPDITRVQLPYSDHFSKIFKEDVPFIILGYDVDNDIYVSWNPENVKERLNAKSNVSLYSRFSTQGQVKTDKFKFGYLTNGEKFVLFKRENVIAFFDVALSLFKKNTETNINQVEKNSQNTITISEITDNELLQTIEPLLKKNQVLQSVEITTKHLGEQYKDMSFKDWYKIVSELYRKMNA